MTKLGGVRFERTWAGRDQPLHQGGCNPWENPLWPLRAPRRAWDIQLTEGDA